MAPTLRASIVTCATADRATLLTQPAAAPAEVVRKNRLASALGELEAVLPSLHEVGAREELPSRLRTALATCVTEAKHSEGALQNDQLGIAARLTLVQLHRALPGAPAPVKNALAPPMADIEPRDALQGAYHLLQALVLHLCREARCPLEEVRVHGASSAFGAHMVQGLCLALAEARELTRTLLTLAAHQGRALRDWCHNADEHLSRLLERYDHHSVNLPPGVDRDAFAAYASKTATQLAAEALPQPKGAKIPPLQYGAVTRKERRLPQTGSALRDAELRAQFPPGSTVRARVLARAGVGEGAKARDPQAAERHAAYASAAASLHAYFADRAAQDPWLTGALVQHALVPAPTQRASAAKLGRVLAKKLGEVDDEGRGAVVELAAAAAAASPRRHGCC